MTDHELMQLSEVVGLALKQRGATITTAESCTGGWVAKAITDIAGSSAWFERGFVT
ncbi:CinA family protein, partial [Enterobacter hormaechei]